jgi:hypothetical protein
MIATDSIAISIGIIASNGNSGIGEGLIVGLFRFSLGFVVGF